MQSEPPIMRGGDRDERPTIRLTDDDYLAATRLLGRTDERAVGWTHTIRRLLDQRTLIDELWRTSHFGWIPEVAIRRALTLAGEHEVPSDSLHETLRQLLERGCVEHDDSGADTGEHHWRLTDTGRQARLL